MSLTTAGLTDIGLGKGVTPSFSFSYDPNIPNGAALANSVAEKCEADFLLMRGWFGGIGIPFDLPLAVNINASASAHARWPVPSGLALDLGWGSYVAIYAGANPSSNLVRYLLVSEVTEMLMMTQNRGWFVGQSFYTGGDEGSMGEGLSRFLGVQFQIHNGLGANPPSGFGVTRYWLNGARPNFVDIAPDDNQPDITTGCTTLFLYYLHSQLGKSIPSIISAGASPLAQVYQNLTGDPNRSNAWTGFINLVDKYYPQGSNPVRIFYPAGDNLFPVSELVAFDSPAELTCGDSYQATVTIDKPAMAEVVVQVLLSNQGEAYLQVPNPVVIGVGETSAQFPIQALAQQLPLSPTPVTLSLAYAATPISKTITVVSPKVASIDIAPSSIVICGNTMIGTLALNVSPQKGPAKVSLSSNNPNLQVPSSVEVEQNQTISQPFTITTSNIQVPFNPQTAIITATLVGNPHTASVTIVSPTVAVVEFQSPPGTPLPNNTIECGGTCTAVVALDQASELGDVDVNLLWGPAGFAAPATAVLSIKAMTNQNSIEITAPSAIGAFGTTQGILFASYAGTTVSVDLNVTPTAEMGILASVTLFPATVKGGDTVSGVVTLEKTVTTPTMVTLATARTVRIPPGSTVPLPVATLSSTQVTVPAGANPPEASFTVTTFPLDPSATDRTIAIVANAFATKSAILTFES